jgi:hypothetical protein
MECNCEAAAAAVVDALAVQALEVCGIVASCVLAAWFMWGAWVLWHA